MKTISGLVLLLASFLVAGCKPPPAARSSTDNDSPASRAPTTELVFTYGSEKEEWIKAVTNEFHQQQPKTASGKLIRVKAIPQGSGECIDELIAGTTQAHLTSPASRAFIELGNAKWRAKTGKDLIGRTENLVLSPVVIAMWKPMAEALGWGTKPIGWEEILTLAREPRGWAARGSAQWGMFRFGHTHPQYSNSGLITLLATGYAATGKKSGLTLADIGKPETGRYIHDIEQAIVHYGSSTGFFGKKMFANGPQYLSAAVLYENMVIESYRQKEQTSFPVVAVYPKEGTFWSDHPAGVVEREWVTDEHRDAAQKYLAFLLARPQQEAALRFGFRPGLPDVPLGEPIDAAHGVNPNEPQTTLDVPAPEVIDGLLEVWKANKKRSSITLVIDVSGSMNENRRMPNARAGAQELIKMLGDGDLFSLAPFSTQAAPPTAPEPVAKSREHFMRTAGSLIAEGGTALYDAIAAAYKAEQQASAQSKDKISAIVVLTDGDDTHSKMKFPQLLQLISGDAERKTIRIFTIGYDSGGKKEILQKIADVTQARFYEGKPENIREVFKDISTFF